MKETEVHQLLEELMRKVLKNDNTKYLSYSKIKTIIVAILLIATTEPEESEIKCMEKMLEKAIETELGTEKGIHISLDFSTKNQIYVAFKQLGINTQSNSQVMKILISEGGYEIQ